MAASDTTPDLEPGFEEELRELVDSASVHAENDLVYLLGLIREALGDADHFDGDGERAEWVVAQFCQELQKVPDISKFYTGEVIPKGEQRTVSQEWILSE